MLSGIIMVYMHMVYDKTTVTQYKFEYITKPDEILMFESNQFDAIF